MFHIKINNEIQIQSDNLDDIIIHFNEILSTANNDNDNDNDTHNIKYINDHHQNAIVIELEFNNKNIKLESDIITKLTLNDIYLLPFFIFSKNKLNKMNVDDLLHIINLNPQSLLDIITYDESLLNPYVVLSKIFHMNDDFIYQSFILYLNKTISIDTSQSQFNINAIVDNFIYHSTFNNQKYKNLFMYYISSKQILPFKIKYQKYISKFNLL